MSAQTRARAAPGLLLTVQAPSAPTQIPGWCADIGRLVAKTGAIRLVCDVGDVTDPDAVTVDALARLQLTVGRLGCRVQLRHPAPELDELLAMMGLSDVIAPRERSVEAGGQSEQREVAGGIEEERDTGDASA